MSSFYLPAGLSQSDLDYLIARSPEEYYDEPPEIHHCPRCGIMSPKPGNCNPCWGEIMSESEDNFNFS